MPVFFIEPNSVQDNHITIAGPLGRHLVGSLRLLLGEELWLGEPGGPRYRARVINAERGRLTADIISQFPAVAQKGPHITVGVALVKTEHMEWAIQKATELGADRIMPLVTRRAVVRMPAERLAKRTARWASIAREAAQQSMRWDIPQVTEPQSFIHWCAQQPEAECRLILWENSQGAGLRKTLRSRPQPKRIALAIGPEGGFDNQEVEAAQAQGFETVSLGTRILRTESAVVAALTILQYEWGDLG